MKFSEIAGHKDTIDRIVNMVDSGHLPHAILLSGPSGIGKMNLARALVQYLQCQNRSNGDSCGVCPACVRNKSMNNPDVHFSYPIVKSKSPNISISSDRFDQWKQFLEESPLMSPEEWNRILGAGNSQPIIHVDEAADISRLAMLSPLASDQKIFVIWQPEKLQQNAANKLLKLIEEPLGSTVFIFVSNNPSLILPTIFSRTQRLNLYPLSDAEVFDYLKRHSSLSDRELSEIARLSEGNLRRAEEFIGQTGERTEFSQYFIRMMRSAYSRNIVDLKELSDIFHGFGREKSLRFLEYCAKMTRENFVFNFHNRDLNMIVQDEETFSKKFSPFINERNVEKISVSIDDAARDIARNANGKIVFFDFLLLLSRYIRTS
ncbi:MAG: DNA polymerase III subunit [Muribaculaceae bacterium]|nr:DNA polymerase III subunit [Bacteroidales bacterium]MBD5209353.1 DNA polymerase III subunit [Bacteroidales bacterium]MDE6084384.1 DNA polymerase III subunit [Muribaculaceae bacterium]